MSRHFAAAEICAEFSTSWDPAAACFVASTLAVSTRKSVPCAQLWSVTDVLPRCHRRTACDCLFPWTNEGELLHGEYIGDFHDQEVWA